jgi:hypothetical protein
MPTLHRCGCRHLYYVGDTVSNMDLGPVLAAHKERADKDKDAIMTMVCVIVLLCHFAEWQ